MAVQSVAAGEAPVHLVGLLCEVADDLDLPEAARGEEGGMAWRLRARHRVQEPDAPVTRSGRAVTPSGANRPPRSPNATSIGCPPGAHARCSQPSPAISAGRWPTRRRASQRGGGPPHNFYDTRVDLPREVVLNSVELERWSSASVLPEGTLRLLTPVPRRRTTDVEVSHEEAVRARR